MRLVRAGLALLWALCVLSESLSVSTPQNAADGGEDDDDDAAAATWTPSHTPAEVSGATAAASRTSAVEEDEQIHLDAVASTAAVVAPLSLGSTEVNAAASSRGSTVMEEVSRTEDQRSAGGVATAATPPLSPGVSSATPTPELQHSAGSSSTTGDPPVSIHTDGTPSAPAAAATGATTSMSGATTSMSGATAATSGAATTLKPTTSPGEVTETHAGTQRFAGSPSPSATSSQNPPASSASAAAAVSTEAQSSTTVFSTSLAAILVPRDPKRLPNPPTPPASTAAPRDQSKSTAAPRDQSKSTAAPRDQSKSTAGAEPRTCSARGLARSCLIAIACLALLATVFMAATIVLCTRLPARSPEARRPRPATEMMCISALLPERSCSFRRHHNPVTNGVLVFPRTGDSEEDGGDTLTLSSFLPENERYV